MCKTTWPLPRVVIMCGVTVGLLSTLCVGGRTQGNLPDSMVISQETPLVVSAGLLLSLGTILIAIGGGLSLFKGLQAQVKEYGAQIVILQQALALSVQDRILIHATGMTQEDCRLMHRDFEERLKPVIENTVLKAMREYALTLAERKEV